MSAPVLQSTAKNITRAAAILRAGGLVAMPTETVYGLAANASDAAAVANLYSAKDRPSFNPLIAHIANLDMAHQQGQLSPHALALAKAFWPGPLTLVVNAAPSITICDLACAGLGSVALRIPAHPVAQSLLNAFDAPLVAPSANPSGQISPTTAGHVAGDMADRIDLILDGGPCRAGIESTIIDARGDRPALLRPGSLDPAEIDAVWPGLVRMQNNSDAPQSPGQLLRHYAPRAQLRLNATQANLGEAYLGFGYGCCDLNLSPAGDLSQAAANIFTMLRALDTTHARIAVAPIPDTGLGEAINDRLTRAAKA